MTIESGYGMKSKTKQKTIQLLELIEFIIAILIIIAILLGILGIMMKTSNIKTILLEGIDFSLFLSEAFSLVIGIEFTRMLIKHSANAAIEVLLFAIARQLVIAHTATWEMLIGVVAIAGVFAIRKYLFIDDFHRSGAVIYDANLQIAKINSAFYLNLPEDGEETIGAFLNRALTAVSKAVKVGAFITIGDFQLRIETMKGGHIDTISIAKMNEV